MAGRNCRRTVPDGIRPRLENFPRGAEGWGLPLQGDQRFAARICTEGQPKQNGLQNGTFRHYITY